MTPLSICQGCLEKQRRIDLLLEENTRLKAQLHYRNQKQKEGFFGSSTPSAQRPVKPNTDKPSKPGGRPKGHPGQGRKSFDLDQAARVVDVELDVACPDCGYPMEDKGVRYRSVLEIPPPHPEPTLDRLAADRKQTPVSSLFSQPTPVERLRVAPELPGKQLKKENQKIGKTGRRFPANKLQFGSG